MDEAHSVTPAPNPSETTDTLRYWCYHCQKRVSVESLADDTPDLICLECKNGFIESISAPPLSSSSTPSPPPLQFPSFNRQFLQILRLVARATGNDATSTVLPPDHSSDAEDFLRIEFDDLTNVADEDENEVADAEDPEDGEFIDGELAESVSEIEEEHLDEEEEEGGDRNRQQRQRSDLLRLRIRDFTDRGSGGGRNLDLDWAEIIRGLEERTIELRVEMPDGGSDGYVGNPEDYVDAAEYEVILQNLAENDGEPRKGSPPAARSAIAGLPTVEVKAEGLICAICKEALDVGKKLECEHVYHLDCIVPWLESRNSCPVCRFELPTDDPEYEDRKKRQELDWE